VLTADHITHLRDVFTKVCGDLRATLMECNPEDDHVHLLAGYPPKIPITALVNSLTGVSARRVRQRYKIWTQCEHLWSPSYFAASCGGAPLEIIQQYVEQQRPQGV
jgi:putative transposase